jgi:type IV pilus assembly protein PilB
VASSLRAAVSQRLIRTLCPVCQDIDESGHGNQTQRMMEEIKSFLPSANITASYRARGCETCNHTGYAGCTAIYEIMPITDALRELIMEGRSTREIHRAATAEGMLTLRQAALLKVAQGRTTMQEVRRVVPDMGIEAGA